MNPSRLELFKIGHGYTFPFVQACKLFLPFCLLFLFQYPILAQSISIDSLLNESEKNWHKPEVLIEINNEIIRQEPFNYHALYERGEAYSRLWEKSGEESDYSAALQDFSEAIALNERFHPAYYSRSGLYLYSMETDLAMEDISHAILLDINNPEYYQMRGKVYLEMKNYHLANANFDIAIKILRKKYYNRNKRDILISLYKDKSYSLAKAGKYKKAIKAINKAIDFGIGWESVLYKGNIYAEMGEYKKALRMYNYITKRTDHYLPVYLHRGRVLYALNQKDMAVADWVIMIQRGLEVDIKNTSIKPGF